MKDMSICGLECYGCEYKDQLNCHGCRESKGNMSYGVCEIAKCATEKELDNCALCESFPCETLNNYSYDPEHGDNGERIRNLEQYGKGSLVS